jgi:ferric enterobactin receptor
LPGASFRRTQVYPSFHVDHPLSKTLDLTLSYSKRIDRAPTDNLRPYAIVTDPTTITLGNPALRDQSVDAYELNLHYHRKSLDAGIIIYDRETSGLWNNAYTVNPEGLNVVQLVNAGHKSDRGAQIDVSMPIVKRVKATASINLFYSRVPLDPTLGSATFSSLRSTGNATLEWNGADRRGAIPGDIAQLQLTYESASRDYQIHEDPNYSVNLSYTHSFSRTLSLTGSINRLGTRNYRHTLDAPLVQEDFVRRETQPTFKLKLVKTLGPSK